MHAAWDKIIYLDNPKYLIIYYKQIQAENALENRKMKLFLLRSVYLAEL